ncbi:VanZ family protein [Bounagaea algeriensis]
MPTAPAGSDKAVHVALFAALAATGGWAGFRSRVLLSALTGYAVLSEVVQHVLPLGRTGDPADALADVCGMAAGWVLANGVRRVARLSRRRSQRHG